MRWAYFQLPGDAEGWAVVVVPLAGDAEIAKWERIANLPYPSESEARALCEAHNGTPK